MPFSRSIFAGFFFLAMWLCAWVGSPGSVSVSFNSPPEVGSASNCLLLMNWFSSTAAGDVFWVLSLIFLDSWYFLILLLVVAYEPTCESVITADTDGARLWYIWLSDAFCCLGSLIYDSCLFFFNYFVNCICCYDFSSSYCSFLFILAISICLFFISFSRVIDYLMLWLLYLWWLLCLAWCDWRPFRIFTLVLPFLVVCPANRCFSLS